MKALALAAVLAAGCASTDPENLTRVTVLKFDEAHGCFAAMTAVQVDPALDVPGICGADVTAMPTLVAGVDHVEIVIDYGADVHFADVAETTVPPPVIGVLVDGAAAVAPQPLGPLPGPDHRVYYTALFTTPPTPTSNLAITITVAPGFAEVVPQPFVISPAVPTISVAECGASACSLTAGVGVATAEVTAPGTVSQMITFRTFLNSVPQDATTGPVATTLDGDHTSAIVAFPVPDAGSDASWRIDAILGATTAQGPMIHLTPPTVTASLGCAPCTIAASSVVNLTVTAPEGIHMTQAVATARLDGVPQFGDLEINLDQVDQAALTISGLLQLAAPDTAGTWTIDVAVDGYHAQTVVATIIGP